ncbi:hypothetical protein R1flu_003783 [Riccia fluitans]|uniref:Uncharacterized protein n=1 Tax=Riccia fluitans TaxID=41844 RepID=A0ABD1Y9Y6_9MARC
MHDSVGHNDTASLASRYYVGGHLTTCGPDGHVQTVDANFSDAVHLGKCTGHTYLDLMLEATARIRNNENRISSFKDEVKKVKELTKEAMNSLDTLVEVQKANKWRIAELVEEKAAMAVLQVKRDTEASQRVAELQTTLEISQKKNEELSTSVEVAQREAKAAQEKLTKSQASIAALLLQGMKAAGMQLVAKIPPQALKVLSCRT